MQTLRVNVCGVTEIEDCTQPEAQACSPGTRFRNNVCAPICTGTQAYASTTSNECIDCPTTAYQGVVNGVCIKCDPATQFFAYDKIDSTNITASSLAMKTIVISLANLESKKLGNSGKCVSKSSSEYKQLSKTDLQYGEGKTISSGEKCWEKTSSDEYESCVFGM